MLYYNSMKVLFIGVRPMHEIVGIPAFREDTKKRYLHFYLGPLGWKEAGETISSKLYFDGIML